jgi:hypothetical protein
MPKGSLEISGELANADSNTGILEAAVTIKLYEEMGQNIGGFSVLARSDTDAGGLKFRLNTGLPVERVKRHSLQWKGPM